MKKLRKVFLLIIGLIFGGLVGLLYNGSYLDHRILVNGQELIELSESEAVSAVLENPGSVAQETFVSFFGLGGFWVDGTWPIWVILILFPLIFGWIGYRVDKFLKNNYDGKKENID